MQEELKRSVDNSIRSLFQLIVAISDASGECVVLDQNSELANISAGTPQTSEAVPFDRLRKSLVRNVHPEDRESFILFTDHDLYVDRLKELVHLSMECRIRHSDRRYYWSEIIICNTTREDSTEGNDCLFMIRDIDERKSDELRREAEERAVLKDLQDQYDALFEENMTDQQTGCYNRKGLKYYTDIVIDDARTNGKDLFVCIADLNGLKHLNDTYGHPAGDEAIRVISTELRKAAPAGSKTVRFGGDEFMIIDALEKGSTEPESFAEKVDSGVAAYNKAHSNPFEVGVSYGWVLLPPKEGMTGLDEYIELADAKMYEMRVERDKYRRE